MPAARVDVAIAANKGGSDLGGVGSLEPADKSKVYSRNSAGTADGAQLLRAVLRVRTSRQRRAARCSSGIDGPARGTTSVGSWSTACTTTGRSRTSCGPPYRWTPTASVVRMSSRCTARPRRAAERGRLHGRARRGPGPVQAGHGRVLQLARNPERQRRMRPPGHQGPRYVEHHRHGEVPVPAGRRSRPSVRSADQGSATRCSPSPSPSTRRVPARRTTIRGFVVAQARTLTARRSSASASASTSTQGRRCLWVLRSADPDPVHRRNRCAAEGEADVCQYTDANGNGPRWSPQQRSGSDQHDCGLRPRGSVPQHRR